MWVEGGRWKAPLTNNQCALCHVPPAELTNAKDKQQTNDADIHVAINDMHARMHVRAASQP